GQIWDGLRSLRKNNTGYDLKQLYIGSEGTLGIITAAVFRLTPSPAGRETGLAACPDVTAVTTLFDRIRRALGDQILAFELMPHDAVALAARHVQGVESPFDEAHPQYALFEVSRPSGVEGLRAGLEAVLEEALEQGLISDAVLAESETQAAALWAIREGIPEAQTRAGAVIKHDVSVPLSRIPEFIERGTRVLKEHMPDGLVIPFGHVGDGNIHFNLIQPRNVQRQDFLDSGPAISRAMYDLADSLGGSFSAEHGIGEDKTGDLLRYRSDVELNLMRAIKSALDPTGIMNPDKVLQRS
ncbi:MAG: FAD-binding oxidoreductase, partial [Aquisalimonadaceae bacterium]